MKDVRQRSMISIENGQGVKSVPILDELIAMTERMLQTNGRMQTTVPFFSISRNSRQTPPIPSVLTPSFCLILQGTKKVHLGKDIATAYPGEYLASLIDLPATAQVVGSTEEQPYICLRIDFTAKEIADVIMEAEIEIGQAEGKQNAGAFIGKSDPELLEMFRRLLQLCENPKKARFLSPMLKREMIFHLLSGDYGHLFIQQALFEQQGGGIGQAIAWIKDNYSSTFTVEELAKANNMSVSGLHHKFKAITAMGPLQYQKQLRLQEARRLMLSGAADATTAALEVGYESPSQFSREYRRLFGLPPLKDIKAVQKNAEMAALLSGRV